MRWGILGPLLVADEADTEVAVPPGRQRALVAALLTRANQVVSVDELVELLWDGSPPAGAARTVRVYVVRLRQTLGPTASARIVTQPTGYLCRVADDEFDVLRFERLCREAGAAAREKRWVQASGLLAEALGLWRGEPLADVPSDLLRQRELPRLDRMRVQAVEDHIDAEMHLHRHEPLIPQLRDLVARHPLRERMHAHLMRALARTGRRAEALEVYRSARRLLVDELGIEPGPELRYLHQRVLASETEPAEPSPASAAVPVPRQLPAAVRHFTGRRTELDTLTGLLPGADGTAPGGGTVVISAIDGSAGIGKTALAVHWAHQHADRFPDGQLYVDLRGFDPSGRPMAPAEAVRGFLSELGVPARRIPAELTEQSALYRSQLAGRRMLIVLDNARDVEHVRPLLPGTAGCLVLVTSRAQLGSLIALDGAVPVTLDLLTDHEARDLLIRRLGRDRVLAEEHAAGELTATCARLPLALNIAAAHAVLRPELSLSELVDELRDVRRRLDTLAVGAGASDLRAVFSWSYRALDAPAARMFRLLGLHPGPDIGVPTAAALAAMDPDDALHLLDDLTRAHLLTRTAPGRYGFHDLLRAYATEQVQIRESRAERRDALRRVLDFYVHTAYGADRILSPYRPPLLLDPPPPGVHPIELPNASAAMDWFDAEHADLMAAQQAATHGRHHTVWLIAWTLHTYHYRRGLLDDELAAWQAALAAAEHLPDAITRTRAHRRLGRVHADLGRRQDAFEHLYQALELAERLPDPADQAHTHQVLAWAWGRHGDDRRALRHATEALRLFRAVDQPIWLADTLNTVGWYAARLGDHDTARAHCQAALDLHRRHDHRAGEADALGSLGYVEHHTGHHGRAVDHYRRALDLYRGLGNAVQAANTLDGLGHPQLALGWRDEARATWHQALGMYREQGRVQDAERVEHQLDALDRPARA